MEDRCVMMAAGIITLPPIEIGPIYDPGTDPGDAPPSSEATFNLDSATGALSITGLDLHDNNVKVAINTCGTASTTDDLVTVTVTNIGDPLVREFAFAAVKSLVFNGLGGADRFENNTALPSKAYGGAGNDTLLGGSSVDKFFGGDGFDFLDGRLGNDILNGESGGDRLFGDAGNDTLRGGDHVDMLFGGLGNDALYGDADNDYLDDSAGANKRFGGTGADHFYNFGFSISKKSTDFNSTQGDVGHVGYDPSFGWFDVNMSDAGLRSNARLNYQDFLMHRRDMLDVYAQAKQDGVISSTELADLRKLSAATTIGMTEDVRNLSSKVVNANAANTMYKGQALGNLAAGDSSVKLEKLVNKWFLGLDRPIADTGYQYVLGSLFQNGPAYLDIDQGAVGDCYFVASLGAVAQKSPSTIRDMFIDNGDGTFSVKFYNGTVADYLTVDRYLPILADGSAKHAGFGGKYYNFTNELWVALAEKAYAQINASGWIGQDNTNTYSGIENGWTEIAFEQITGHTSTEHVFTHPNSYQALVGAYQSGNPVTFGVPTSGSDSNITPAHVYILAGYDPGLRLFLVYNPQGANGNKPSLLWQTWTDVVRNFDHWIDVTV